MTKYYPYYSSGELMLEEPVEAEHVICHLLGHDGHRWDICKEEDGLWHLYVSANSKHHYRGAGTLMRWNDYSFKHSRADVVAAVIELGGVADAYALTEAEKATKDGIDAMSEAGVKE